MTQRARSRYIDLFNAERNPVGNTQESGLDRRPQLAVYSMIKNEPICPRIRVLNRC